MLDLEGLDHERYVRRAIELAREAGERGDGPYGSLLVRGGSIVAEETNHEVTGDDIALHPELTLARSAASEYSPGERAETVMYTSTEPCPMCAAGMAYAGLGAVVYSVSGARAAEIGDGASGIPCDEVVESLGGEIEVRGPVLEAEGAAVHREYR